MSDGVRPRRRRGKNTAGRRLEPTSAAQLIADTIKAYGLTEELRSQRIVADWDALVGPRIAQHARPLGITRRVLRVQVSSSAWLHELGLLKQPLLTTLWQALGEPRLFDDLSFQLAGRDRSVASRPSSVRRAAPVHHRAPGDAEPGQILEETAAVQDEELRRLIAGVRLRHRR